MKISPFEKRVKRRIVGREHQFFVVCTPGLKKVCLNEMLAAGFAGKKLELIQGGIEFQARLNRCMAFNLNLRSPLRILMRVANFNADSFEKLEKKIESIDWILYLPQNCSLEFNVTSKKSRLYHSDAIAQRCEKIIFNQLKTKNGFTAKNKSNQTIYIRAEHNNFTVSIDTTGDLLFKRGIKKRVTLAPLRDNIAFAMLRWAGFSFEDVLLDPMCGSGTFSLEAAMMKTNVPPGFYRSFAFENWPGFSPKTFAYMKKEAQEQFVDFSDKQIFTSDIHDAALAALEQNISNYDFCNIIDASKKDFFTINPFAISHGKKGIVMLNPPYGKRLGQKKDTISLYQEIGKKLKSDFRGWRVGIILPSRESKSFLRLKLELKPVFHGGLDIFAGIGKIE
ncbi:MAG: RNA methyltransferase [Thermodesulfobacteriota bacterium]